MNDILMYGFQSSSAFFILDMILVFQKLVFQKLVCQTLVFQKLVCQKLVSQKLVFQELVFQKLVFQILVFQKLVFQKNWFSKNWFSKNWFSKRWLSKNGWPEIFFAPTTPQQETMRQFLNAESMIDWLKSKFDHLCPILKHIHGM